MASKNVVQIKDGFDFRKIGGLVKRLVHPKTTGSKNLGVSICYLNPGEEVIPHKHEYEEAYFILNGEGTMILDDETIHLEKNLSVYVPANALHGQKNDGNEPLAILCSLTPPPPEK
jgi:mannose-6-phosphate isomerase-like protein (cupin superfamily)